MASMPNKGKILKIVSGTLRLMALGTWLLGLYISFEHLTLQNMFK